MFIPSQPFPTPFALFSRWRAGDFKLRVPGAPGMLGDPWPNTVESNLGGVCAKSFMGRKVTESMGNLRNATWKVGRNEKR